MTVPHICISRACLAIVLSGTGLQGQTTPSHTIPAREVERQLLVPVLIRDQGPFWFVLDTAIAHTTIDRQVAQEAQLDFAGPRSNRTSTSPIRLDIGGQDFEASLDVADLGVAGYQRAYDQPLAGALGMDFFRRFIVVLDYDAQVVTLQDASRARDLKDTVQVVMENSLPYVEATMKIHRQVPVRQRFLLDTSSGDAINDDAFSHPGRAAIGPDLGRAESLCIGSYRFTGVNGTSGTPKLGGELLYRFLVTIDIAHGRLTLTPSRHFSDAFLFDTSGLDLERSEDGLRILRVFPRTPGQEAGWRLAT